MAGNYEKGIYNQLMKVMARLDSFEKEHKQEVTLLNKEISDLKKENKLLWENQLLWERHCTISGQIMQNAMSICSAISAKTRKKWETSGRDFKHH